jgi:hypothetical protein
MLMHVHDETQYTEIDDEDSFFDSVNELVLDANTGLVDKKAMAKKKARRETQKERTKDGNKTKDFNLMKSGLMPAPTRRLSSKRVVKPEAIKK